MNKKLLDEFITHIEDVMKRSNENDYVKDSKGYYPKAIYMKNLIFEAKELIKYGEDEIALENMIENLNEASIFIDKDTINLARQAFEGKIQAGTEKTLNSLTKYPK